MSNDATVPNITESFSKISETPGSRAHIVGHICHCSPQRLHDTFSDHRFWIVVLDTLHLMAPLFVRHLSFTGCHIATKGAYFQSTDLQTQSQGSDELPHIWSCQCRTGWLLWWSRGNSSPSWWMWNWSGLPLWTPPSPSWKGDLLVIFLGLSTA